MKYLIFIVLVLTVGCSVSKSNIEKKDLEIKTSSNDTVVKSDSSSTSASAKTSGTLVDNSITVKEETREETKQDSTGVKVTVKTTTKTTTKNNIAISADTSSDSSTTDVEKEKEESKTDLEVEDNGKVKSSFDSSSYGIYGILLGVIVLALLGLKYYKKFISLLL